MNKKYRLGLKTWVEIDKKAIRHNYKVFKKLSGHNRLMAVVKSNAYGHGIIETSQVLEKLGVDWLGVDSMPEALSLRKEKITKPILVLAYTLPELFPFALSHNISVAISSFENIKAIKKLPENIFSEKQKLKIHIKIDTGMIRHGFYLKDLTKVLKQLDKIKSRVLVEGVFSHLATAGEIKNDPKTKRQIIEFEKVKKIVKENGLSPIFHLENTAGVLAYANRENDMVRIGLGIYGIWPNEDLKKKLASKVNLKPVLSWKTVIAEIKNVKKGNAIGYNFTEKIKHDGQVAICPIGYWHGYGRNLSSRGRVLIRGQRAKVLGLVSMGIIVIDVSKIKEVRVGDEVTLVDSAILANETAEMAKTISYEILTRINPLIKRFYI